MQTLTLKVCLHIHLLKRESFSVLTLNLSLALKAGLYDILVCHEIRFSGHDYQGQKNNDVIAISIEKEKKKEVMVECLAFLYHRLHHDFAWLGNNCLLLLFFHFMADGNPS